MRYWLTMLTLLTASACSTTGPSAPVFVDVTAPTEELQIPLSHFLIRLNDQRVLPLPASIPIDQLPRSFTIEHVASPDAVATVSVASSRHVVISLPDSERPKIQLSMKQEPMELELPAGIFNDFVQKHAFLYTDDHELLFIRSLPVVADTARGDVPAFLTSFDITTYKPVRVESSPGGGDIFLGERTTSFSTTIDLIVHHMVVDDLYVRQRDGKPCTEASRFETLDGTLVLKFRC